MHQDMHDDEKLERITDFLSVSLGFSSKNNAWAGPDHWKFRKIKGSKQSFFFLSHPIFLLCLCIVIVDKDHNTQFRTSV